jgi:hypothetical protein
MDEPFELPVIYNGEEKLFPAQLQQTGYTHRFVVDVYGQEVLFEPDEERNYRAMTDPEALTKDLNVDLLKAIAATIESLVR